MSVFSSIEEDKDSKNRYYEAKPSNKVIGTLFKICDFANG